MGRFAILARHDTRLATHEDGGTCETSGAHETGGACLAGHEGFEDFGDHENFDHEDLAVYERPA